MFDSQSAIFSFRTALAAFALLFALELAANEPRLERAEPAALLPGATVELILRGRDLGRPGEALQFWTRVVLKKRIHLVWPAQLFLY